MQKRVLCFLVAQCLAGNALAQEMHPTEVLYPLRHDTSPPLRSIPPVPQEQRGEEEREIPNRFSLFQNGRPHNMVDITKDHDPVIQDEPGRLSPVSTLANFDGINNLCSCYPPDPNADVGPNHIIETVNTHFAVYSKTGTLLYGPATLSTLWSGFPGPWTGASDGDPVVRYDHLANRWLVSQFYVSGGSPFYELVAVSQTSDPLGSWYRYAFSFTNFVDYPKFGLWPDGYYMTANMFNPSGTSYLGPGVAAFQRDSMLTGQTAKVVFFQLASSRNPMLPSDLNGTPSAAGTPNTLMELATGAMNISTLSVDWTNTASSVLSGPTSLTTAAWTELCPITRNCVPQLGTSRKLDGLGDRLMNRLQYRNFIAYKSIVASHTVNTGSSHAAVRWYEFRNNGSGWTVYQMGTYAPDSLHRWMGSIAMDGFGNIALGYSVSGSAIYPSIRVTGRQPTDVLGQMTFAEQTVMAGTGYQSGTASRWGDYTMMAIDPSDDQTFWYTNEYIATSGTTPWRTRIASFKIADLAPLPVQLVSFTGAVIDAGRVRLDWRTLSEINNYGFQVERRSNDRTYFEPLAGSFIPGHGTTNDPQHYTFTDESASTGARFYRLRQMDLDGTIHFTEPISVNNLTGVAEAAPRENALQQNYPNPFNPTTRITFSVKATGHVLLGLYNTLGQHVATLFDDVAETGQYYTVPVNGSTLASGVYFYRMQSGNYTATKRLVLMR